MKSPTALILSALFAASACVPTPADNPGKSVDKAPAQVAPATDADTPDAAPKDAGVYALGATSIDGEKVSMSDYQGKVTLIVNVARY